MTTLAEKLLGASEGFDMTSEPPTTLDQVVKQNNKNKHGEYFVSTSQSDTYYFYPVSVIKNGKLQGAFFAFGGSVAGKAKSYSVGKADFGRYKHIKKADVPAKIKAKLDAKAGELYKKL